MDLRALALCSVSTADLISPALELAIEYKITTHDACYVALAKLTDLPLITADQPLARKLSDGDVEVLLLKDI